jgi:hypothetical protein
MANTTESADLIFNSERNKEDPISVLLSSKNLQNVFKSLFPKAHIVTSELKRGSNSSAVVYLPKQFLAKKATIIIWPDD